MSVLRDECNKTWKSLDVTQWPAWMRKLFILLFPVTIPLYLVVCVAAIICMLVMLVIVGIVLWIVSVWVGRNLFE